MTRRPSTLAQGPGYTQAEYLATLAAGIETGWWDEHSIPARPLLVAAAVR